MLKYSLTWVTIPSTTVSAWTQEIAREVSQPSTITVEPKEITVWGTKRKVSTAVVSPVSVRIKNWWEGGPWNHHSRSGARIRTTVSESREFKESYSVRTSFWLLESVSSELTWELARSRKRWFSRKFWVWDLDWVMECWKWYFVVEMVWGFYREVFLIVCGWV